MFFLILFDFIKKLDYIVITIFSINNKKTAAIKEFFIELKDIFLKMASFVVFEAI